MTTSFTYDLFTIIQSLALLTLDFASHFPSVLHLKRELLLILYYFLVTQVLSKLAAPLGRSVAKNVSPPGFPKHPLCSADVVVYPSSANAILRYDHVQSFSFP